MLDMYGHGRSRMRHTFRPVWPVYQSAKSFFLFFSFLVSLSPRSRRFNLGRIQVFRRLRSISLDAIRGSGILVVAFAHIVLALSETRSLSRKGYTVLR